MMPRSPQIYLCGRDEMNITRRRISIAPKSIQSSGCPIAGSQVTTGAYGYDRELSHTLVVMTSAIASATVTAAFSKKIRLAKLDRNRRYIDTIVSHPRHPMHEAFRISSE